MPRTLLNCLNITHIKVASVLEESHSYLGKIEISSINTWGYVNSETEET